MMRCEKCQGAGHRKSPYIVGLKDGDIYTVNVCTDCGGTGIAHCCEGMREQPEPETEPEMAERESK